MASKLSTNRPLKYGQVAGPEVPTLAFELSASMVFENDGGKFVKLDSSEQLVIAGDGDTEILGWAHAGDRTSGSTAGRERASVNISCDAVYALPISVGGAASARTETQLKDLVGKVCDLIVVSNVQRAAVDTSTEDTVQIVGYRIWGTAANEQCVLVRMNPSKIAATGVV